MIPISFEIVRKVCEHRSSTAERQIVLEYFDAHPESIARYFTVDEWSQLRSVTIVAPALASEMHDHIRRELFPAKPQWRLSNVKTLGWRLMTAAALCAGIVSGLVLVHQRSKTTRQAQIASVRAPQPLRTSLIVNRNEKPQPIKLDLPDGSRVTLMPRSSIRYKSSFAHADRDIDLAGTATFDVAANARLPFTVKTAVLHTTALGTKFTVMTQGRMTSIRMISGKVVVRAARVLRGWQHDVFLSRGERLRFDSALVRWRIERTPKTRSFRNRFSTERMAFNNAPLADVLTDLAKHYGCHITFQVNDIRGINFTGSFAEKDSVETILRLLTTMNGLIMSNKDGQYFVGRRTAP